MKKIIKSLFVFTITTMIAFHTFGQVSVVKTFTPTNIASQIGWSATLNQYSGKVFLGGQAAAGTLTNYTIVDNLVDTNSMVILTLNYSPGHQGAPTISYITKGHGLFDIWIFNADPLNDTDAPLKFEFIIAN